jgi:hypothetical protein
MGDKRMATDEGAKVDVATGWLNGLAADFYDEGMFKFV